MALQGLALGWVLIQSRHLPGVWGVETALAAEGTVGKGPGEGRAHRVAEL